MADVSEVDDQQVMLDGTVARAHACAAGYSQNSHDEQALGRSKGGLTTKLHALCDALGHPIKFTLTPGQRHDVTQAAPLLNDVEHTRVLADKAYDSEQVMTLLANKHCEPVIPSKSNRQSPRTVDSHEYKERHLIECFFSKIKHFRRVFARFDKTASAYLGFCHLAGALIWMR
jgi:transposase